MKTVLKYTLSPTAVAGEHIEMPAGAFVVHVHEQRGSICLWAEVDRDAPAETRKFWAVPTGATVQAKSAMYVGTAHIDWTVWHIYEEKQ